MFSSLSPLFAHFFSQYGLTVFYCFAYFIIIFVQVALCYFLYNYFFTFTLEDIQSAFDRLAFWRDHRRRSQVNNNNAPNGNLNKDRPEDEQGLMDGDEDGDGDNDSDASSSTTTAELLDELSALTREDMEQYLRQAREQMLYNRAVGHSA